MEFTQILWISMKNTIGQNCRRDLSLAPLPPQILIVQTKPENMDTVGPASISTPLSPSFILLLVGKFREYLITSNLPLLVAYPFIHLSKSLYLETKIKF